MEVLVVSVGEVIVAQRAVAGMEVIDLNRRWPIARLGLGVDTRSVT